MKLFDERAKGQEWKFAHDSDQEFHIEARRSIYLGQWVGEQIGLGKDEAREYAYALMAKNVHDLSEELILGQALADIAARGQDIDKEAVRTKFHELRDQARRDLLIP